MNKYILGNGGFSQDLFEQFFITDSNFKGFIVIKDDNTYLINDSGVNEFSYPADACFFIGTGNKTWRQRFINHFTSKYEKSIKHFPNLASDKAYISSIASIGVGNIFCPFSLVNANAEIGNFNCINIYASVNHDCKIGDNNILSPYSSLMGYCKAGDNNFLGVNTHITPSCVLENDNTLSAGEVLFDNMGSRQFFQSGVIYNKP